MKTVVRRIIIIILFLAATAVITFLMAPFVIDSFILPRVLEKITVIDKYASVSRITPFSTRGTLIFEDGDTPVASIPRFELRYTPTSLLNQKISSLTIDHATIHLVKSDKGLHIAGFSSRSANPTSTPSTHTAPLFFPAIMESLILKQCSVILHERGQPDFRVTLSSRIRFTFANRSSSGFVLSAAEGSFLLFDSMSAQGQFSFITGPEEHAVSVNLQTALDPLANHFAGRRNIISGSMLMDANAVIDANNLQIKDVTAAGTIKKFHLTHKGMVLLGGEADSTISFSLSGTPQHVTYQLGTLAIDKPIALRATITGTGIYSANMLQTNGTISTMLQSPLTQKEEPLSAPLTYDLQLDTSTLNWQAYINGEYNSKQLRTLSQDQNSVILPNVIWSSSLTGSQAGVAGTIDFSGKPFSIKMGSSKLDISGINLAAQLQTSARRTSLHISGSIPAIKYSSAGVIIENLSFALPYHFPFSSENTEPKGSLTIDSVTLRDSPLFTVSSELSQQEDSLILSGSVGALFSDDLNLHVTAKMEQKTAQGRLEWTLDKAPVSSATLPSAIPLVGGLDFNGSLASSGRLLYRNRRISGDAQVNLEVDSLQVPEKNININNISCGVIFPSLPALFSMPSQHCSAELLEFGNFQFSDAKLDFRVEDLETVFIEKSSVKWCQGKLESTGLRLSRSNPEINTALYCSKINFSDLLNQFGLDQAEGEGSLNGKLPIALSKDGLYFDDGFLFSTPGTGGIIRFSNTDMLRQGVGAADVGGYLDYSMKAMEDFTYQWTKLSFNSTGDELLLTMELNGKPRTPLPYGFKNGMIIETDKGDGLQYPIRLDVNFRLPLAELFQFGQNIQSIKENM